MKQGWEIKKLGEVCDFKSGTTIASKLEKNKGEIIYAKVGDMNLPGNEEFITVSSRYVNINEINVNQIIPKGSIIFPKRGGAIATNKKRRIIRQTIVDLNTMALVPAKIIDKDYLFFWFQQIDLSDLSNGTSIPQINNYSFDNVFISFPKSLTEQQRIVAILNEAFASIAKAKANAEQSLKNAKELFESYLQSVFANKGEGWEEKALGDVCKVERGSSPRPIDKYFTDKPDGVNWIKIGDTKEVDKYIYKTRQKITKEGALQSRFVDIDDFILSNSMSFGKPYIMKTQGYIHDGWFVLRLPKNIDTEFFWYLLASPYAMNQFISLAAGAIVKNISGDLVKKTVLPIPPLKEQKTIVQKLDALSAETKRLEAIYQQKLNDLEELKKSILQKAFNGELKTTNRHQYELERS